MDLQAQFNQAKMLHQQGNLAAAEQLYQQILQADPAGFAVRHLMGVLKAQQGRADEAMTLIGAALAINPNDFGTLSSYGPLLMQAGRFAEALDIFDRAVAIRPDMAQAYYNRGVAQGALKRQEDALASYDKAISLQPDFAVAWLSRGITLGHLNQLDEALASYEKAIAVQPDDVRIYYNRGVTLAAAGRFEEAIDSYDKVLALQPNFPGALYHRGVAQGNLNRVEDALASYDKALATGPANAPVWSNRGAVLRALKRFEESLASCDKAIALQPDLADAYRNRGQVLRDLGRLPEALESYDRALTLNPDSATTWNSRGTALRDMGRFDEALASYSKAIALSPDYADALTNRGYMQWSDMGLYDPAVADLERALAAGPRDAYARGELLHVKMYGADWRDFDGQKALVDQGVRDGHLVVRPFAYQAISDSPADLAACSRLYAQLFPAVELSHVAVSMGSSKIRIGYVSEDFREQATAYLAVGLYELRDKSKFEIIAFDNGASDGSPIRARLEAAFDKFVDISGLSDRAAADRIRAEEIDILVNLNGYFGKNRMGVFAQRAAPLQLNYLGFPGTLGAPYIDYIIADRVVIPEAERHHYSEQVVYLPDSYQPNDSKRPIAEDAATRAEAGLPEDAFVFCNFNQSYKFTPAMFAAWMRILKQVPDSVLWLRAGIPALRTNLAHEAERHGISRTRLVFAPYMAADKHLARHKLADLFLDGLPYNAHTTASDALWAGLPLLTCRGTTFPGRVAASLLEAAGLPELVTENLDDFEKLAVALANDPGRLGALRQKLAQNRASCALFDTDRYRRHLEAAYKTMWDVRQGGDVPRHFSVKRVS